MKVQMTAVAELHPHPKNPKEHTAKQIEHIAESIKMFGWTQPVVANEVGTILIGHGRVEAAKGLGMLEVPVQRVSALTEPEEMLLLTIDNTINQETGFDSTKMMQVYDMLRGNDFPMANLGLFLEQLGDDSRDKDPEKGDPVADAFEKYQNAKEKQMVFYFVPDEYEGVVRQVLKLMEAGGYESKAELMFAMLEHWKNEN